MIFGRYTLEMVLKTMNKIFVEIYWAMVSHGYTGRQLWAKMVYILTMNKRIYKKRYGNYILLNNLVKTTNRVLKFARKTL